MSYQIIFLIMTGLLLTLLKRPAAAYYKAFLIDEYGTWYRLLPHTQVGSGKNVDICMREPEYDSEDIRKGHQPALFEVNYMNGEYYLHLCRPRDAGIKVRRNGTVYPVKDQFQLQSGDRIRIRMTEKPFDIDYIFRVGRGGKGGKA